MTKFHVSSVCGAFAASPVGTKVLDAGAFTAALTVAVEAHDVLRRQDLAVLQIVSDVEQA